MILSQTQTTGLNTGMTEFKSKACFIHLKQSDLIALVYSVVIILWESVLMEQTVEYFSLIELPYSIYSQKACHHPLLLNFKEKKLQRCTV